MTELTGTPTATRIRRATRRGSRAKWLWGTDDISSEMAILATNSSEALVKMANDVLEGKVPPADNVLSALCQHRKLPVADVYRLMKAFPSWIRQMAKELCLHPDVTPAILDEFCNWEECFDIVAVHPKTSQKTLEKMAELMSEERLPGPATTLHIFERLSVSAVERYADSPHCLIRRIVATLAHSPSILKQLADDPISPIRLCAISNPHVEMSVIEKAALTDEDPEIVAEAAVRVTNPAILTTLAETLSDRPNEKLRNAILKNPHADDYAKTIAALAG